MQNAYRDLHNASRKLGSTCFHKVTSNLGRYKLFYLKSYLKLESVSKLVAKIGRLIGINMPVLKFVVGAL